MNDFFNNRRILDVILKRKYHLIIIAVIAIVLSAIFSGPNFITPKFKSTARVYPINLAVLSEESETEQLLEVMSSNDIKFRVIETFRLDTVYNINLNDPQYQTYVLAEYNENVNVSKTEYETVQIKVLDGNPQRASNMCDSIITFYNEKVKEMFDVKYGEMVEITENILNDRLKELDTIRVKLNNEREESGLVSYNAQIERITEGYMNALNSGSINNANGKKLKNLYDNAVKKGSDVAILENRLDNLISYIDSIQIINYTNRAELDKKITYCHVVEHPVPADKKSYPVRWLIVFISTFAALFFALVFFLLLDYRKHI